jgi:hypothetical protein
MKPNNISDVIENLRKELKHSQFINYSKMESLLRSQIEQLLGRIDTEEIEGATGVASEYNFCPDYYEAWNQKSSEIANQIKSLKL